MIYVFDGTLAGLLTSVFEWFERKPRSVSLKTAASFHPDAFQQAFLVEADNGKADRVWKAMIKKLTKQWQRKFYCCYLSEAPAAMEDLFHFACYIFTHPAGAEENFGNPHVLSVSQFAHSVEREKHRMEAFIRFEHSADNIFYAAIDPDFNVLPLISKHFSDRYADQRWIIYDLKRKYGLFYDLEKVQEITVSGTAALKTKSNPNILSEEEGLYKALWKDYFKSTNIVARKNMKLHIRHVPKRYWKYLSEKQEQT